MPPPGGCGDWRRQQSCLLLFPSAGAERLGVELRRQVAVSVAGQLALIEAEEHAARLPDAARAGAVDAQHGEMVLLGAQPGAPPAALLVGASALAEGVELLERAGVPEGKPALAVAEEAQLGGGGGGEHLQREIVLALAAAERERLHAAHFFSLRIEQARYPRRLAGREREDAAALAGGHFRDQDRAV